MSPYMIQRHRDIWDDIRRGHRDTDPRPFPDWSTQPFDGLKEAYNKKYGYVIRIPEFEDIIHVKPNFAKTPEELKAEKRRNFERLLESPASDWGRKYSSVMTWIDNIQDTSSVLYPLLWLGTKALPKAFGKLLPILGWMTTIYDLLNLANAVGRLPMNAMFIKRDLCKDFHKNPFSKQAQKDRVNHIKNWKPNVADAIQAGQVLDQFTGMGLSLGPAMGTIMDTAFGAYHYLKGDPVRFEFGKPEIHDISKLAVKGLNAASHISTQGQTFTDELHFWTYVTAMLCTRACGYDFQNYRLSEFVVNPMDILLPAPAPTDPITIEVIKEKGLSVENGIGWPYNGEKLITLGDLIGHQTNDIRSAFLFYCMRHQYDSYGMCAASCVYDYILDVFQMVEPDDDTKLDDTDDMKVFWKMVKAPLLPTRSVTQQEATQFEDWLIRYKSQNGELPGVVAIEQQFIYQGIPYRIDYPTEPDEEYYKFWPPEYATQSLA